MTNSNYNINYETVRELLEDTLRNGSAAVDAVADLTGVDRDEIVNILSYRGVWATDSQSYIDMTEEEEDAAWDEATTDVLYIMELSQN